MQRTEVIAEKNKILAEKYNLEGKWKENEQNWRNKNFISKWILAIKS